MSFRCLKKEDFVQPDCLHGAGLSLGVFFWYFKEHSILISEVSPLHASTAKPGEDSTSSHGGSDVLTHSLLLLHHHPALPPLCATQTLAETHTHTHSLAPARYLNRCLLLFTRLFLVHVSAYSRQINETSAHVSHCINWKQKPGQAG